MITAQIKNCASKLIDQAHQAVAAYNTGDPFPEQILVLDPLPATWAQGEDDHAVMQELVGLLDMIKKVLDAKQPDRHAAIFEIKQRTSIISELLGNSD